MTSTYRPADLDRLRHAHTHYDQTGRDHDAHELAAEIPALIAEVERLRRIIANVESLTLSTDGDEIGPDVEIPVGEVCRMLFDPNPQRA